jgi:protein O-mannosyl-transferase
MHRGWLFALLLFVATLAAYQPAWHGQRIWDDAAHLTPPELRSLDGLGRIWTHIGATQQYYPLSFSAFWVEHKLWGEATLGYHVVNVFLHCVSAWLFLTILRRLQVPGAYLAAAIFALHPIHVESVAWMSQLKNTLSGVFYLAAGLAYLHFDGTRRRGPYTMALGLFVLGLMSKSAVVTLPAALLVVLWWKRGTLSWRRDVLPLSPFFLAGLAAGLLTLGLEQDLYGAKGEEFHFTMVERCLIAGRAVWFHLGKLLWPVNLLFMYPRWHVDPTAWWQYLYPAAAILLAGGLWALRRWSRAPLAALLLLAGTLFPTLGFFNVCTFRYSFVNDHHQYLAGLGIVALVSAGAALASRPWTLCRPLHCGLLALLPLALLATLTWRQCRMYSDVETLWRTTVAGNPGCYLGWENLGNLLFKRGQVEEAIAQFRKALDIRPDYAEGHNDLGLALAQKGQLEEALVHYTQALQFRPGLWEARVNLGNALAEQGRLDEAIAHYRGALAAQPDNARIHANIGHALFQQGKTEEAIPSLRRALELLPTYAPAHETLGLVLLQKGQADEAIAHFQQALQTEPEFATARTGLADAYLQAGQPDKAAAELSELLRAQPNDPAAHCHLAALLNAQGKVREAIQHYRAALQAQADSPEALNNLAWILAAAPEPGLRNGAEAVTLAERACQLTDSKQATLVGTLAAAYAQAGRFTEAVTTAERAARLAEQASQPELAARNRQLAEQYRAGQPARDPR